LAAFLGADLDFVRAFPRFGAVFFFRANVRCFRLTMSVSR